MVKDSIINGKRKYISQMLVLSFRLLDVSILCPFMYGRIALLNENTAYSCGRFKKTNMCKEGVTIFHGILKKLLLVYF